MKPLLGKKLVITQRQESIVDPGVEEIAEMREQTLFRRTGFLQVTIADVSESLTSTIVNM